MKSQFATNEKVSKKAQATRLTAIAEIALSTYGKLCFAHLRLQISDSLTKTKVSLEFEDAL